MMSEKDREAWLFLLNPDKALAHLKYTEIVCYGPRGRIEAPLNLQRIAPERLGYTVVKKNISREI